MRFVRSIVMPRPADWLITLVHAGMACAIIVAGVVALHCFENQRNAAAPLIEALVTALIVTVVI
jgi:hypothetical protein